MQKRKRRDQDGLYRRPDSPYWWASYIDASGKRVRRSTGATDRREAEALLAKWRVEAHRARHWDEQPPRTFEDVMVEFLRSRRERRTWNKMRQHVRKLRETFGGLEMNALSPADVRGHIEARKQDGVSNATINRELEVLSAAINFVNGELGWGLPNPVSRRKLREPEGRIRWISQAEAEALIRAAESEPKAPHLADFIRLALHTGCRKQELLGLEWKRVDLQAGLIYLEAIHTKAGKRRAVPLNRIAREAILNRLRWRAQHCPASPWVFCDEEGNRIGDVKRSFATACKRAGISDFRIHDLRHTCAAWLVSAGVPLPEVRDLLGHSTVKMTEKYAHLAPDNVRAAVAVLEGESRSSHGGKRKGLTVIG